MKTRRRLFKRTLLLLSFCFFLLGSIHLTLGRGEEDEKEEIKKIRVAISPFQDVFSLHIAEEKGWDLEEGLDMTLIEVDWPGAQEIQERLEKYLPTLLGEKTNTGEPGGGQ